MLRLGALSDRYGRPTCRRSSAVIVAGALGETLGLHHCHSALRRQKGRLNRRFNRGDPCTTASIAARRPGGSSALTISTAPMMMLRKPVPGVCCAKLPRAPLSRSGIARAWCTRRGEAAESCAPGSAVLVRRRSSASAASRSAAAGRRRVSASAGSAASRACCWAALARIVCVGINKGTARAGRYFPRFLACFSSVFGGWGGIRTHGGLAPTPVFKTGALNRSATHPSH
jgi:hypothetical protein